MKKRKVTKVLIVITLMLLIVPLNVSAYKFNGSKISNPKSAHYYIQGPNSSFTSGLVAEVKKGVLAWNKAPEIQFTKRVNTPGAEVRIEYVNRNLGDYYAQYRASDEIITFNKKWKTELNKTKRTETAVHEVGHALGLAHTQEKNNSKAVMRALGFNNKTVPLSDDLAGIKKKY